MGKLVGLFAGGNAGVKNETLTTPGISLLKFSTISCFFLLRASSCLSTRASPSCEATSSSCVCERRRERGEDRPGPPSGGPGAPYLQLLRAAAALAHVVVQLIAQAPLLVQSLLRAADVLVQLLHALHGLVALVALRNIHDESCALPGTRRNTRFVCVVAPSSGRCY